MSGQGDNGKSNRAFTEMNCSQCKRQRGNRRVTPSEGYYYLHTIGWVCRRNKKRRETDSSDR